jgi:outer membrane protein TolC
MKSAEEDRRIAEERYNLGSNTLLDLLVATSNYTQAQSNKVSSSYDFIYAKTAVQDRCGKREVLTYINTWSSYGKR